MEIFYIPSTGGGQLHCRKWLPESKPKAVVQLVHGIAEHIGRYDHFARFLNQHGYIVTAEDHMGHGGSIVGDLKGYFNGGWMNAVADVKALHDKTAAEHPGLPYIFLGHSMGSFLLRTYLYTYPEALNAAIISGTGWQPAAALKAGKSVLARQRPVPCSTLSFSAPIIRCSSRTGRRTTGSALTTPLWTSIWPIRSAALTRRSVLRGIC